MSRVGGRFADAARRGTLRRCGISPWHTDRASRSERTRRTNANARCRPSDATKRQPKTRGRFTNRRFSAHFDRHKSFCVVVRGFVRVLFARVGSACAQKAQRLQKSYGGVLSKPARTRNEG